MRSGHVAALLPVRASSLHAVSVGETPAVNRGRFEQEEIQQWNLSAPIS